VGTAADRDGEPAAMLRCEQTRRQRKGIDERLQRRSDHPVTALAEPPDGR